MPTPTTRHLFVVRMWQEADAVTTTLQWRGSVKHMHSDECHYFTQLADLLGFISAWTEGMEGEVVTHNPTPARPCKGRER